MPGSNPGSGPSIFFNRHTFLIIMKKRRSFLAYIFKEQKVMKTRSKRANMEYCKKCGTQLEKDANYCSHCGASVKEINTEEFKVSADDLVKTIKKLLHEGNVRRIIVKDEKGKTLFDMPVTIGVVGTILAPWLAALGVIGALATNCTIVVERTVK